MRSSRLAVWIAIPVLVVMIGFLAVLAVSDPDDTEATSPLLGHPAPALAGDTIDGGAYDLEDHRGEWVLVNYFAPWCVPCVREHPELVNFQQRHAAAGDLTVVSVVYDSDIDAVTDFFAANGGDWPVVEDPDGLTAVEWGVSGVPESYLVAPDGTVVYYEKQGVTATGLDRALALAQGDGSSS